jgi:hypothetical protein
MTLIRTIRDQKNLYLTVNETILSDSSLSWNAKGIYLYAFSRPNDYKFSIKDLANNGSDNEKTISAGLAELKKAGYLHQERTRDKNGKLSEITWVLYETPELKEEASRKFGGKND